jgi:hypothetical protein
MHTTQPSQIYCFKPFLSLSEKICFNEFLLYQPEITTEEAHCHQSYAIMLFYGRTHIIIITKYSLVSPGPKHSSANNIPQREISSFSLCA